MARDMGSAFTSTQGAEAAAEELARQMDVEGAKAVLFFCSPKHDGAALSAALHRRYPGAEVIGCTTAGEFTQSAYGMDSVSALALSGRKVKRCAGALARFEGGVEEGTREAMARIGQALEMDLREADPQRHVGLVLVEGVKMREEDANVALGNAAPLLSFVGGSAGDNGKFEETRVFYNGEVSNDGAALLLMEMAVPFTVVKACSVEPTGKTFRVTRADVPARVVYELDGKPIAQVYAQAVGAAPDKLDSAVFRTHPLGLMIQGAPWIRSPQRLLPDGALKFYCQVHEGIELHLMRATDLVQDTRAAIARARKDLGGLAGGLAFNCILRRLEMDAKRQHDAFLAELQGLRIAGFHTYGESWLGHINQTLTALLLGGG